ncbi:DUF2804 domain-containing protein [Microbacterium sp. ARD32]|uniref:DUF2804 domain-containing protein n=1 Tax=Microbacterium sp. ARD32 TaxID=2962577 RepID=UPI0028822FF3|nr:DUF2804 domain-containing protein [Microbacterium sp. ARD32]MDT0157728.1 DUF2804 domain-containing protein [Microbacterium sp. ARD32]
MPENPIDERELTATVSLTRPDGTLNPDAVGWARSPLVDTGGIARDGIRFTGRNKRWEYWCLTTPTHVIGLTVSSIDYAAVHEVWVLDRATERTWHRSVTNIPPRGVELPPSAEQGPSRARAKDLKVDIDEVTSGTRLRARIPGVEIDVIARLPEGHERLAVVVPWSSKRFQYTVKDVARPASGTLTLDGETHVLPEGDCWAVLDHGRGRWPYDIHWNWGAGSGRSHGRVIGIQVGAKWTDGTGSTENAFVVDGRLHKISVELDWDYDISDWRRPWRITGGGLDAVFAPVYDKQTRTNLGLLSASTDQCFGDWSGTFRTADGDVIAFEGIFGWVEEVHNRW